MIFEKSHKYFKIKWILLFSLSIFLFLFLKGSYFIINSSVEPVSFDSLEDYHYQNRAIESKENIVSLTFDDGPDRKYTESILKVLKKHNVPATFFMIGSKVNENKDLVRDVFNADHEIGNHTYTHSRDVHSGANRIKIELNSTSKIIENIIGLYPKLYRPPFLLNMADMTTYNPNLKNEKLEMVTDNGFIPVGIDNDSKDWNNAKADVLYRRVITNVFDGKKIILLHDGGAEGKNTAEAVDLIIIRLKKEGFKFAKVSALLGMNPSEAYFSEAKPAPANNSVVIGALGKLNSHVNESAIVFLEMIKPTLLSLTKVLMVLVVFKIFIMMILYIRSVLIDRRILKSAPTEVDLDSLPSFDVLVPVYNEEKNVTATLLSLIASNVKPRKIIVIDDGSVDKSYEMVKLVQKDYPEYIDIISMKNSGKSAALNRGLRSAKADVIIALDGDTIFLKDTIEHLLIHFLDDNVGAVAGKVEIANRSNFMEKLQTLEYISGQNLDKKILGQINGIGIVPGAIGAWCRNSLDICGGFSTETLVEDRDLTLAIHRMGKEVRYEPKAIALTEAPHDIKNFGKQRFRWIYGTLQCFWKHRGEMFSTKNKSLGFVILPSLLTFDILIPLFYPLIDFVAVTSYIFADAQETLVYYSLLYLSLDLFMTSLAFLFDDKEKGSLLFWIPLQKIIYRPIVSYSILKSVFRALEGTKTAWVSVEKTGSAESFFTSNNNVVIATQKI